jgi:signal transduction histidine kinase
MAAGERLTPDRSVPSTGKPAAGRTTLSQVQRRRTELWTISIVLIATVVAIVVLTLVGRGFLFEDLTLSSLTVWIIGVLLVGLAIAFILYVLEIERNLRRLSDELVEEQVTTVSLARRVEQEHETVTRLEELDRLKSDFIATVSHELRTPLTAIIGAAKTIARKGNRMDPEQHASMVEMISRQGQRLFRLVDDVLTASRSDSELMTPKREHVDLAEAAQLVIDDLRHAYPDDEREITLESDPPDAHAWGDPDVVQQILANLVENAIKYAGNGAPIKVTVSESESEVILEVADSGKGIPPEHFDSIFERFRQVEPSDSRSAGGFGLGLFIVKSLVELHRGTVDVTSEVGKGTAFGVHLPQRSERSD